MIIIGTESGDFQYWKRIIIEQDRSLDDVVFNDAHCHQINKTVLNNIRRDFFVNGEIDIDELEYHIIGIGGAAISLSFDGCSSSTSIELEVSQVLYNERYGFRLR